MNGHLSDLALDALAPRADHDGESPHLAGCDRCNSRIEAFREARSSARASPRFEATFSAIARQRPARHTPAWVGLALAAAAVLAFVAVPRGQHEGLKGGASLALVPLGDPHDGPFHPGEKVALAVGGAGHRYALVLGAGEGQPAVQLWPEAPQSGEIPEGASARLNPVFEVTPGSLHLVAIFSDQPLDAQEVLSRWRKAGSPAPPKVDGEAARAQVELRVVAP